MRSVHQRSQVRHRNQHSRRGRDNCRMAKGAEAQRWGHPRQGLSHGRRGRVSSRSSRTTGAWTENQWHTRRKDSQPSRPRASARLQEVLGQEARRASPSPPVRSSSHSQSRSPKWSSRPNQVRRRKSAGRGRTRGKGTGDEQRGTRPQARRGGARRSRSTAPWTRPVLSSKRGSRRRKSRDTVRQLQTPVRAPRAPATTLGRLWARWEASRSQADPPAPVQQWTTRGGLAADHGRGLGHSSHRASAQGRQTCGSLSVGPAWPRWTHGSGTATPGRGAPACRA